MLHLTIIFKVFRNRISFSGDKKVPSEKQTVNAVRPTARKSFAGRGKIGNAERSAIEAAQTVSDAHSLIFSLKYVF